MEHAIQTLGLTKYYGDVLAVDHVDFSVKRGELFGFLGPNGAGKTTTIRMLVGLTVPTEGTALVNGHDIIKEIVKIKRRIGVVPETSNLYNELTTLENLLFMTRLYHVQRSKREEWVKETLKTFDLWTWRNRKFGRLSKGLKRRVTVAAALVHKPDIVFLDEPTTGLDVMSARSLRAHLKDLQETGVTIFLTTHYIEEADQLCDRIAIIVKGELITVETPQRIKSMIRSLPVVEASFDVAVNSMVIKDLEVVGEVGVEGNSVRILTEDVSNAIKALTAFALDHGLNIEYVNTLRPSLEDAFVKLTGVEPEVMKMEKERGGEKG